MMQVLDLLQLAKKRHVLQRSRNSEEVNPIGLAIIELHSYEGISK